jgi:hypothetical protein
MITALWASVALAGVVTTDDVSVASALAPRRVALLVGIDDYADPALQGLAFASKDATDLARVLSDPAVGGWDHVRVVTAGPDATAAGLVQVFEDLGATLRRDDTFFLYLSGHGTLALDGIDGTRLFFIPSDGRVDDPFGTAIDIGWLEQAVSDLPARRRVMVLDTCHDGRSKSALSQATASSLRALKGPAPAPDPIAVSESEARLFAAEVHQPAMEDPNLQNGVYTHFLINALTRDRAAADLDRDGLVDVVEAHAWARDGTLRHTGGQQVPRAEYRVVGREEIWLAGDPSRRQDAERAMVSSWDALLDHARLFVDGTSRGVLPGAFDLSEGQHLVEVVGPSGQTLARRRIVAEPGAHYALEDLVGASRPSPWVTAGVDVYTVGGAALERATVGAVQAGVDWPVGERAVVPTYTRIEGGSGQTTDWGAVAVGAATVGSGLLVAPWGNDGLALGPIVETGPMVRLPEGTPQVAWSVAPGARLAGALPGGLVLRYDLRWAAWPYQGALARSWAHGVAIGWAPPG